MLEEKIYATFKERYDFEIDRQYKIRNSITMPLSFVAVTLTGLMFMIQNIAMLSFNFFSILCYFLIITAFILAFLSLIFTTKVVVGYEYAYLPKLSDTMNDLKKLERYYETHSEYKKKLRKEKEEIIEADFDQNFKEYFIEAADTNNDTNNKRSKFLYLAQSTAMISIILTLLAFLPFFINKYIHKSPEQNKSEVITMTKNDEKPKPNTSKEEKPKKPQKSPLQHVKEDRDKATEKK